MFICVYGTLCRSASLKYLFLRVLVSLVSVLLIEKCITCPQLRRVRMKIPTGVSCVFRAFMPHRSMLLNFSFTHLRVFGAPKWDVGD